MSLFRKKESTHFERDEEGRVTRVIRNGHDVDEVAYERVGDKGEFVKVHVDPEYAKAKTASQLRQEYYKEHPERRHPTLRKIGSGMQRLDKKIVEYNRTSNIMNPQRTRRPVSRRPYSTRNNYNPFGDLFDTGMTPMRRPKTKKKTSKTQYAIVGGKAYPIAGTGRKKKKNTKKKKKTVRQFNDPFDFGGWL